MANNAKKLIVPALVLTALLGVAVGSTFGLFSTSKTINNHISAGKLTVGFHLTELKVDTINDVGAIENAAVDLSTYDGYDAQKGVDLAVYSNSVFTLGDVCPGMGGYALFSVSNPSGIAFTYTLEVISKECSYKNGTDMTAEFDDVMTVTVEGTQSTAVAKGSSVDTNKVSFLFKNGTVEHDNLWQEASFSFDIKLVATQVSGN